MPTGDKNWNKWLADMEDKWAEAVERSATAPEFNRHPDGQYMTRVTLTELGESNNGRNQVAWTHTIISGDLEGEFLNAYDGLDGEDSLYYLALKLKRFGYDPEEIKIRNLPRILKEITANKPVVKVRAVTKGDFQNLHIRKVYDPDYDPDEDYDDDSGPVNVPEEDEAPSRNARSKTKANPEPEPPAPTRRGKTTAAPAPASVPASKPGRKPTPKPVVEEDDDDDEEEEVEETPEPVIKRARMSSPAPARKPVAKAPPAPAPAPARKSASKPVPPPVEEDEDEEEEDEDSDDSDELELQVGMKVAFQRRGQEQTGIVDSIDEDTETVYVKVGSKTYPVSGDQIEILAGK